MSLWNQNFIKNTANNSDNNDAYTDQTVSNQSLKRRISDLVQDYSWSPEYFPNIQQRTGLTGTNIPPQVSQPFFNNYDVKQEPSTYDFSKISQPGAIYNTTNNTNDAISNLNTSVLSNQLTTSANEANSLLVKNLTSEKRRKNEQNHSSGNNATSRRPAFILKLWNMVNDKKNQEYIRWSDDGESFIIQNKESFDHIVLPRYFKHSNYSSFVRQLNLYGWHKVQDITSGAIQSGDEIRQFKSPYFIRGREDLLDKIVRNKGAKGSSDKDAGNHSDLNRILDELDIIKSNQMDIAADLNRITNDNKMLWRECYESMERHKVHADMFERILRLLASAFSSSQGTGGKFVGDSSATNNLISSILAATGSNSAGNNTSVNGDTSGASGVAKPRLLLGNGSIGGHVSELSSVGTQVSPSFNNNNNNNTRISTVDEYQGAHLSELSTPADADTLASIVATTGNDSAKPALFSPVATTGYSVDPIPAATNPDPLSDLLFQDSATISPTDQTPLPATGAGPSSEGYDAAINPLVQPFPQGVTDPPVFTTSAISVDPIPAVAPGVAPTSQLSPTNNAGPNSESVAANENDLEDLMRIMDFQGDSLQRIQDRLAEYLPPDGGNDYPDSSTNLDSIPAVPSDEDKLTGNKQESSFDVNDFLYNANPEDLGESDNEEPVRKKARN